MTFSMVGPGQSLRDRTLLWELERAVRACFEPFEPGPIKIWADYDIDHFAQRFVVMVWCFPEPHIQRISWYDFVDRLAMGDVALARHVGTVAGTYFAAIREPVPENVVLGEN